MNQTLPYTILNVDDDEAGRYVKSRILRRAGFEVIEAGTGADALRLVAEENPQLVLLDVKLPDMSGFEVCRVIKANPSNGDTMVLQVSASRVTTEDRVYGLEGGADAYLTEPVDSSELVATARALLRLYSREQENRALLAELRHREQELQESEAQFRASFELAGVGKAQIDAASGKFTRVNDCYCEIVGYSAAELASMKPSDLTHPQDRAANAAAIAALLRGDTDDYIGENRYVRKDGKVIWTSVNAKLIRDSVGKPERTIAVLVDITERKLGEIALRETAERLRLAQVSANLGIWDWNARTGELAWTAEQEIVYGVPASAVRKYRDWRRLVHPDDLPRVETERDEAIRRREPFELEYRILRPSGEIRWLASKGQGWYEEAGELIRVLGVNIDITERKRIEQQREQQARLLDISLDAIIVWGTDRGIEYWNQGAEKLYGYSAAEAIGRSTENLLKTTHALTAQEIDQQVRRQGEWEGRLSHTVKGGGQVAVLSRQQRITRPDGEVILEVNRDITVLEEAERAVAEAAAHLKAIVETAVDGIITIDERGIVASINPAAEKIFGYSAREVIGRNVSMLMPEPYRAEHNGYLNHYRMTGERKMIGIGREVRGRRKDGSDFPVDLGVSETQIGDRRFFTGLVRDASARKEVEQRLIEAKEAADAASRAKSEFLANMSHEIRSPMTGVMGYAEILLSRLSDPKDIDCVRTIKQSGEYLLQIINDILDLAKIEAQGVVLSTEPIHLPAFLTEIHALMDVNAREKTLPLFLKYDGVIPQKIESDPKRLRQILINLLSNAIKFTDQGSVELVARFLRAESELQFEVSDSGIGMTDEQQRNLFHPFTQGDSSVTKTYGGTGLGLAITQRLVNALGGTIAVDSLPGRGTTFRVTVPVQVTSGSVPARNTSQAMTQWFDKKLSARVLVCEDQPEIRRLMAYFIEKAGCRVTSIDSGEAAVDVISRAADNFDLVLLDIQMPRLDGYEVARRARRAGFSRPIIAVTAAAMPSDRDRCLEAGCDDYLAKPIDVEQLLAMIARYTAKVAAADVQSEPVSPARHESASKAGGEDLVDGSGHKNLRILVVDDRPVALNATSRLLEMEGYSVRTASTGHMAIRLAKEFIPDLVLLDISLPDISGYEVFRRLKSNASLAKTIFIALSGHGYEEHIRAREIGFDDYVMKPFDIKDVDKLIAENLRQRSPSGEQ